MNLVHAALVISISLPMSLSQPTSQWLQAPLPKKGFPEITSDEKSWTLTTQGTAGGYVYLFPEALPLSSKGGVLSWKWEVSQFPQAVPTPPFKKETDDYPVRIGLLLGDGEHSIRGLGQGFTQAVQKKLSDRHETISAVLFWGASRSVPSHRKCGPNPYSDQIILCLKFAGPELTEVHVDPYQDASMHLNLDARTLNKLKIVGLWIVADSDDSHSSSKARISDLKLIP